MTFIVHYTGDWVRANADTSAHKQDGYVTEYKQLSDAPAFDREQFEFMMDIGEVCFRSGSYVWQIRH